MSRARRTLCSLSGLLVIGALTTPARAAPTPSVPPTARAPEPPVVPPRLTSSPEVTYPAGASGDAVVVLVLTINADGTVRDARAVEGDEPFATEATEAALKWHFEPATRAGQPVAAVIRFEITFHAPEAPPRTPSNEPDKQAAPGSAPSGKKITARTRASQAIEVQVSAQKPAPEVSSFTRAEVRQLPGAFGDPFRAIEALPGVTPIASGLPFFYVRGAPPGNVGYFIDGVRVPYLYHVGLGPSVIHPGMVDRVDLYPGGYPAQFGRFSGGIVSGETTAPRADLHGEGNIRLFDLGALAETGFAGGHGTVLLGGRYSYTAAILSLIAKDVTLDYRDYQMRVSYDLTPRDRVSVFGFGSYDLLEQTENEVKHVVFGAEFYRLDLRYDHFFGKGSQIRYAVTLGFDQTRVADQRNAQDRIVGSRVEIRHPLRKGVVLRGGLDTVLDGYKEDKSSYVDPDDPRIRRFDALFPPRTDLALGAWADAVLELAKGMEVTPGTRVDLYTSGGVATPAVDPRISARLRVTDHVRIVHAYGIAHQPPSFVVPVPGLVPGKLEGGLQTSFQTSAGVETDLPSDFTATATVFQNAFFNMSDLLGTTTGNIANVLDRRATGSAYGFELFVRRPLTRRLGGFLTYTLSRSTRRLDGRTVPSAFDRTHVANVALAYNLGRNWRAGSRLVFYTGTPKVIRVRSAIPPPPLQSPDRDPPFYRVDLRLEKRWPIGQSAWLAFVAEMLNATFHKETIESREIGPVTIPSIGLEGGF